MIENILLGMITRHFLSIFNRVIAPALCQNRFRSISMDFDETSNDIDKFLAWAYYLAF